MNRNSASSSKGEEMKAEEKSSVQKANTHRSKHSEMEQHRRSKISERFQMLRDIIPQNDQKRDKASFLLEVIEYIQFLRETLQMYEGPCHAPTKLMQWRNDNGPAETYMDHSQVTKNGSGQENIVVNPMLTIAQNLMESDLGTPALYKATEFSAGSATTMIPHNMHAQQNMFAPLGRCGMRIQPVQESVSDVEKMVYQSQTQLWQGRSFGTDCAVINDAIDEQDLMIESGSSSMSDAYSQGILNTLTQVLRSSGVDLSQARISVQIDVVKRANDGSTAMASCSKDNNSHYENNPVTAQTGVQSFNEESGHAHKRR